MVDLLNLFRDATETVYDGNLCSYPYNQDDKNGPLPGQDQE